MLNMNRLRSLTVDVVRKNNVVRKNRWISSVTGDGSQGDKNKNTNRQYNNRQGGGKKAKMFGPKRTMPEFFPIPPKDNPIDIKYLEKKLDELIPKWQEIWSTMSVAELQKDLGKDGPDEETLDKMFGGKYKNKEPVVYEQKLDKQGRAYGKGGRKNAMAMAWVKKGTGTVTVNRLSLHEYFHSSQYHRVHAIQGLVRTGYLGKVDVQCIARGGGLTGQAGAVRHAISKALLAYDPAVRPVLKPMKLFTRDTRVVERKKAGLKKARKAKQWVKR